MGLKLIFWHDEENHEFHRRIIECIKLNTGAGSSECGNDFVQPIGRTMWNGDTEPDSCAHGFFALSERGENRIAIGGFNLAKADEQIDQLDNGRPALRRFHLRNDLLGRK